MFGIGFDGHPAAVYIKATSMQWPVLAQNLPSGTGSTTQTDWRLATQIEPYGCPRVGTNHD